MSGPYDTSPAANCAAVTPSDNNPVPFWDGKNVRGLWVGVGGDVAITFRAGGAATLKNVPSGCLLALKVEKVRSTGTTASEIVALY